MMMLCPLPTYEQDLAPSPPAAPTPTMLSHCRRISRRANCTRRVGGLRRQPLLRRGSLAVCLLPPAPQPLLAGC
eukprot:10058048-Prorocentrum_lima.AAC.1